MQASLRQDISLLSLTQNSNARPKKKKGGGLVEQKKIKVILKKKVTYVNVLTPHAVFNNWKSRKQKLSATTALGTSPGCPVQIRFKRTPFLFSSSG